MLREYVECLAVLAALSFVAYFAIAKPYAALVLNLVAR